MCKLAPALLLCCLVLPACGKQPAAKDPASNEPKIVKTTSVSGFDADAEPQIHHMSDGSLHLLFELMPPSFAADDDVKAIEGFQDFDKELEQAIGVPVVWDDRELFIIPKPQEDTAEKVKRFLEGYRKSKP